MGQLLVRVAHPVVAQPEQPGDFGLDENVGHQVLNVGVLDEGLAVSFELLHEGEQVVDHAVAPDSPARAVLQLKVRRGDLPAVVLSADQVERGNANVVEEHRVLDAGAGSALASGDQQFHGDNRDPRAVGRDYEPAEVLMSFTIGRRICDGPVLLRAVDAADEYLLAVNHVLVAIAHRAYLDACQV